MNTDTRQRHDTIAAVVLAALVGLATLGALLNAVATATGHPILVGLGLLLGAALVGATRWTARRMRERREDTEDEIAAAAWRAEHMPHLVAQRDGQLEQQDRAGVA